MTAEPAPSETSTADPEPRFDGVLGRDWIPIAVPEGTLAGASQLVFHDDALWTLRPDEAGTDRLLRSGDAVTWQEEPLDPRMPADEPFLGRLHLVGDRLIVTHFPRAATMNETPAFWIAVLDAGEWTFIGPDELGDPALQVVGRYLLRAPSAIAELGDDLVVLVSADSFPEGNSVGCSCYSPLLLRADGTVDWRYLEGTPISDPHSWDGGAYLVPDDDGLLLVGSWQDPRSDGVVVPRLLHSTDGITWEERETSADEGFDGLSLSSPILRRGDTWVATAVTTSDQETDVHPFLRRGAMYVSHDGGTNWTLAQLMGEEELRPVAAVATDDGFFAFPYPARGPDRAGATVYFSVDGTEWTEYRDTLVDASDRFPDVEVVQGVTAAGSGMVALTLNEQTPLWVSGLTPFTPELQE